MIEHLDDPVARAVVTWRTAEQGGRRSGPPTAPVYAATCVFPWGDDAEIAPDWLQTADHLSVLLERSSSVGESSVVGSGLYDVDFLVRDLARPFVRVGERMLVLEGPRVVAEAVFHDVFAHDVDARLDALAAALRADDAGDRAGAGHSQATRRAAADVVDQARAALADDAALARSLMAELSRSVGDSWPHDSTLAVEVLACSQELARQAREQRRTSTAERYYLSSMESRTFEPVRSCEIVRRLRFDTGKDALLARIDPPVVGQPWDLADVSTVVLAARHEGTSLDPIDRFPCFVHVAASRDGWSDLATPVRADDLVVLAWGELYRSADDAEHHRFPRGDERD